MSAPVDLVELRKKSPRMLVFHSLEERAKCKQLFKEDEELKNFTYLDDSRSPVVSEEAVHLLKQKGLKFKALKPITTDVSKPVEEIMENELTPKQLKLIQQGKAYGIPVKGVAFFLVELKQSLPDYLFCE